MHQIRIGYHMICASHPYLRLIWCIPALKCAEIAHTTQMWIMMFAWINRLTRVGGLNETRWINRGQEEEDGSSIFNT